MRWTIAGLLLSYEKFPHKFHRGREVDGRWEFKCGQQDMVRSDTTIKGYGESVDLYPAELCGSCWRITIKVWANG